MREIATRQRPEDAILGEEFSATPAKRPDLGAGSADGTRAFASEASWGVLIGLGDADGDPGIIDQPHLEGSEGGLGIARMIRRRRHGAAGHAAAGSPWPRPR
ncbi:MAG: hypothetical protein U1E55_10580 [Paracoccus sp. (in: a-proteobacteria)]